MMLSFSHVTSFSGFSCLPISNSFPTSQIFPIGMAVRKVFPSMRMWVSRKSSIDNCVPVSIPAFRRNKIEKLSQVGVEESIMQHVCTPPVGTATVAYNPTYNQVGKLHNRDHVKRTISYLKVRRPLAFNPVPVSSVAVAKPSSSMVMESKAEVQGEEMVEGCLLRHGELWNEDIKIHYVECGDPEGDLVVLIHGFPNFWYVWKNQFQALAQAGYHVIAPDLRGYNTSLKPKPLLSYSRAAVVSDIVCLIDQFAGGKPVMVVGHDWGGVVTWALAEDYPLKLTKAVIINVPHFSVFAEAIRTNYRQKCRSWYIAFFQLPWLPEVFMTAISFKGLRWVIEGASFQSCPPPDVKRHVLAFSEPGTFTSTINYYRAAWKGLWSSKAEKPRVIDIPVDVIWGELDVFAGKELATPPKDLVPKAVVTFLPQCSHWPMWSNPEEFNQLLLQGLARCCDTDDASATITHETVTG